MYQTKITIATTSMRCWLFAAIVLVTDSFRHSFGSGRNLVRSTISVKCNCGPDDSGPDDSGPDVKWFRSRPSDNIETLGDGEQVYIDIPLFPMIDEQCLPTGELPLLIFEMKFREMMNDLNADAERSKAPLLFGVVLKNEETGNLAEYGCVVQNTFRKLLDDGRQLLLNDARERFRIVELLQEDPYIIARVEYGIEDEDVKYWFKKLAFGAIGWTDNLLQLEREVYQAMQDVIALNNKLLAGKEQVNLSEQLQNLAAAASEADQDSLQRIAIASSLSFAVCDMLDLTGTERQVLLQCIDLTDRLSRANKYISDLRSTLMMKVANELGDESAFN